MTDPWAVKLDAAEVALAATLGTIARFSAERDGAREYMKDPAGFWANVVDPAAAEVAVALAFELPVQFRLRDLPDWTLRLGLRRPDIEPGFVMDLGAVRLIDCQRRPGVKEADVGPLQVRWTRRLDGHLILRKAGISCGRPDPDGDPFVLVVGNSLAGFRLVGWAIAGACKRPEFERSDSWWIPQPKLRRMDDPELARIIDTWRTS